MNDEVSVVIPTYNRAHVLRETIPSYCQEGVGEVIIINDASTDNTIDVLNSLQKEYEKIKFFTNKKNIKQAASKNKGIDVSQYKYIYFGDDDSYIEDGTIKELYDKIHCLENAGLVAANAIYLDKNFQKIKKKQEEIVKFPQMSVNYTKNLSSPVDSIFCPACFLIESELARKINFDNSSYLGNGFREETDFVIRVRKAGYKTYLSGSTSQINLPRNLATGGAHNSKKIIYEFYCVKNTYIFLRRHFDYIKNYTKYPFCILLLFSIGSRYRDIILCFPFARRVLKRIKLMLRR